MSARERKTFDVFGFATTHDALSAEQILKDLGIDVTPIPAPKTLGGALCGIALRIDPSESARTQDILDRAGIKPIASTKIKDL